jgi:HAE1 family hydrophobic/amphiphilic exporter-1
VIEREARTRQIAVWATPNGRSLGDIVKDLQPKMDALELPPGVSFTYDGQIKQMNESNSSMGLALLLGVVFIYLVLASQFESFIHPLTIMLTLPLVAGGRDPRPLPLEEHHGHGRDDRDHPAHGPRDQERHPARGPGDRAGARARRDPYQAILEAGPERLRPILMTSAAMVLGMLPTAISAAKAASSARRWPSRSSAA